MESLIIRVPNKLDLNLLLKLVKRMGFQSETVEQKIDKYIANAPFDVPLTDNDIMKEVKTVRKRAF
ncbi:MAG: hypothetical protein HGB12_04060 [Bacteroidetes bacterium]|nr:hypothetical protein [Bacteroidota bacterium]